MKKEISFENATLESDRKLIERILKGDESAITVVYRNNVMMVRKYVLENSGTEDDAQDMLQEALVVLWENVMRGEFDLTAKISTYLYSVVRNKWLRDINKRRIGKTNDLENIDLADERLDALKKVIHTEEYKVALQCIQRLGETCRKLLTMFYLEEKGMEEIARALRFNNTDVAKAKKWQCKKELEHFVKKEFK